MTGAAGTGATGATGAARAGHSEQRLRGILLMIAAFATFSLLDATAKYMTALYEVPQIVFARYLGALVFSVAVFAPRAGLSLVRTKKPLLQVVRAGLLFGGTVCNFIALQSLQLAQTAAIMLAIPLFVCALSVPLLGEAVGPRRWAAVTND